jgi:hypothetical protein
MIGGVVSLRVARPDRRPHQRVCRAAVHHRAKTRHRGHPHLGEYSRFRFKVKS